MYGSLGLPPRDPPARPEVVRIWAPGVAGAELVGLLLDGPEPLPRPGDGSVEIRRPGDVPVPVVLLQTASGTRTLVLFRSGPGLGPLVVAGLRLVASDAWVAADGSPQVESAILDIPIPAGPAFLEPEGPP
jgi:hypothetical protein